MLRYLDDLVVLDSETTGLDLKTDEVIEVAALKIKKGKVVEKLDQLVKPQKKELSHLVKHLTGLDERKLANAPVWEKVKNEVAQFVGELPICGHNIDFDLEILNQNGLKLPGQPLDTWSLATLAILDLPAYGLEYLASYLDLKKKPTHRAPDDVEANLELLDRLLQVLARIPRKTRQEILAQFPHLDWPWKEIWLKLPERKFTLPIAAPLISRRAKVNYPSEPADTKITKAIARELPPLKNLNIFALPPGFQTKETLRKLVQEGGKDLLCLVPEPWLGEWEISKQELFWPRREIKKERWESFTQKKLDREESSLALKIALAQYQGSPFRKISLNRQESYIFEEHLANFDKPAFKKEAKYLSASALDDVLEEGSLENRILLAPSLNFLESFVVRKASFIWTSKYLESTISHRRDFWQRLGELNNPQVSDQLFKLTKNLSAVWQEMLQSLAALAGKMEENTLRGIRTSFGYRFPDKNFLSPELRASEEYQSVLKSAAFAREILNQMNELLKPLSKSKKVKSLLKKEIAWFIERNQNLDEKLDIIQRPPSGWSLWLSGWAGKIILRGYYLPAIKELFEKLLGSFKAVVVLEEGFAPSFWRNYLDYFWRGKYTVKKLAGGNLQRMKVLVSPQDVARQPQADGPWAHRKAEEAQLWIFPSLARVRDYFELVANKIEGAETQETFGSLFTAPSKKKPPILLLTLGSFLGLTNTWVKAAVLAALPFENRFSPDFQLLSRLLPSEWDDFSIPKLGSRVAQFVGHSLALGVEKIIISDERLATANYTSSLIDYLREAGIETKVG